MNIYSTIAELMERNRAFVIATVVETSGSSPGKEHFKAIIDAGGLVAGTVGGGKIEIEAIAEAQRCLASRANLLKSYNLTSGPDNLGMQCGGAQTLFYEYIGPKDRAIVFGGGHVSQSLTPLLTSIGLYVTLVDDRPEFATRELHPTANELVSRPYGAFVAQGGIDNDTMIIIVTPMHKNDLEILEALFRTDVEPRFLGVIASKRKAATMREELERMFPGDPRIERVVAPVGIDIGGETPAQIALSIAAQLQAVVFGKTV